MEAADFFEISNVFLSCHYSISNIYAYFLLNQLFNFPIDYRIYTEIHTSEIEYEP